MKTGTAVGLTVAEAFVDNLAAIGVRHAFGVSGGAISFLWSALGRRGIRVTHFRHETGAAFAACEASIATGAPVVVFATTGPGLTNALTGMYAARHEPCQVILASAHTDAGMRGRRPIQETGPRTLPREGLFTGGPLFDYATMLDSPDQLPAAVDALAHRVGAPGGFTAHVSLSVSVQRQSAPLRTTPRRAGAPEDTSAAQAAGVHALLRESTFAIWVGAGARTGAQSVRRLVAATGAPVMATPRGKGVIPETDPHYLGVTGFAGHPAVVSYLARHRPDHILVLGSGLGDFATGYLPDYLPRTALIHVDIDPDVPGKAYPHAASIAVTADVGPFCDALATLFDNASGPVAPRPVMPPPAPLPPDPLPPDALPARGGLIHPARVIDAVQAAVVDAGVPVMAETGNTLAWAINRLRLPHPAAWRAPSGLVGAMGHFGCGVVGAALASPGPVVALVGDGAMLMANEISTAVHHGAQAIWVVFNDSRYNMCAQGADALGLTHVDSSLPDTDFAAFARALGATGHTVGHRDELAPALTRALRTAGPSVVDVCIDPAWAAPTKGRNAGLLRDSTAQPSFTNAKED